VEDPITRGGGPRSDVSGVGSVRVVLAETDAPSSLHYLMEAEGFRVVGCASDDVELRRVLEQDVNPDVVVLDADVSATAVQVARELSPDAHVIVVWPDGVQLPATVTERVPPRLVYEQLGPAIRRAASERRPLSRAVAPVAPVAAAGAGATLHAVAEDADPRLGRAASRFSVTSIVLIAAIVLTMSASFALEGWNPSNHIGPSGGIGSRPSSGPLDHIGTTGATMAGPSRRPNRGALPASSSCARGIRSDARRPTGQAASTARHTDHPACAQAGGGIANRPTHPGGGAHGDPAPPQPPGGANSGNGGSNGPASGGNGDPGQGNGGGDQGGQGGGDHPGDQGGGDQGGGDQGGGDQGGGDQGEDEQGDQGGNDQGGDQGGNDQGGQERPADHPVPGDDEQDPQN
jgi:hypothetical protein